MTSRKRERKYSQNVISRKKKRGFRKTTQKHAINIAGYLLAFIWL
jgi:hypothetical protein